MALTLRSKVKVTKSAFCDRVYDFFFVFRLISLKAHTRRGTQGFNRFLDIDLGIKGQN